ncbi:tetratricopeptide repeat protein [bacterium]|nr:tetratricopeptide repeat protein [bacterium]
MTTTPLRKLAAIMFTDIAGYTKAMSADEDSALIMVQSQRSILKPLLIENRGTFVKEMGDGTLSYFNSAVDAATCAVKLQQATYSDSALNIRVGVHSGQVLFEKKDVFGDVVNVAARLESIAPVGGVCVSKIVFDELPHKNGIEGIPLGLQQLKGVGRLIDVFALKAEKLKQPDPKEYEDNKVQPHSDDEVPSVAVLPLENKGKDEDAFYAYGITADLITDLSSAGRIRVASMKDINALDLNTLSSIETAEKLDVRYIVSGMLWKHGDQFQLSIEVHDTISHTVIWSDRWQESWEELTTIKGKLSEGLLKVLNIAKDKVDIAKAIQTNTEAYEYYLKAKFKYAKRQNIEDIEIARGLFQKAIELDETLFQAKLGLGLSYHYSGDYEKAMKFIKKALKQADEIGNDQGVGISLNNIGIIYLEIGENDKALGYHMRSLEIKEELGDKYGIGISLYNIGLIYERKGEYDKSLDYHTQSLAIREELDDKSGRAASLNGLGIIYDRKGDYNKALDNFTYSYKLCMELNDKQTIGYSLNSIGIIQNRKGDYDKSLDSFIRSLEIKEELNDKMGRVDSLFNIGIIYYVKSDFKKASEYLENSITLQKKIGLKSKELLLGATTYLFLSYKRRGKEFDPLEIYALVKEVEYMDEEFNLRLYELLEEKSFLEAAYKQVQENVNGLGNDLKERFLNYPIPKAIVEAWESLK